MMEEALVLKERAVIGHGENDEALEVVVDGLQHGLVLAEDNM